VAVTPNVVLVPFEEPAPHRRIAMVWRRTSALSAFLYQLMPRFKALPKELLTSPPLQLENSR
jgi:LysR family hydrogen peroxide-inducible transcriptional activator